MNHILMSAQDFDNALRKVRAAYSENIGVPKIPTVTWDDVGGLAHVKADILDTIQLPLEHPELFTDGMKKRSGKRATYGGRSVNLTLTRPRCLAVWSSRNWKNSRRQSSRDFLLTQLFLGERS